MSATKLSTKTLERLLQILLAKIRWENAHPQDNITWSRYMRELEDIAYQITELLKDGR